MEALIGFITGIFTLELILLIIYVPLDNERFVLNIISAPIFFIHDSINFIIGAILSLYYVPCKLYETIKIKDKKFPSLYLNEYIRIPKKDLDKFYWKGENDYYIEPIFYIKYKNEYKKKKVYLNNSISLKEYSGFDTIPLEKFMISNQK